MRALVRILFFLGIVAVLVPLSCSIENLQGELEIQNNSSYQAIEMYIALEDSDEWGENLLDTPIEPGETRSITSLPRAEIKVKTVSLIDDVPSENIFRNLDLMINSKVTIKLTD